MLGQSRMTRAGIDKRLFSGPFRAQQLAKRLHAIEQPLRAASSDQHARVGLRGSRSLVDQDHGPHVAVDLHSLRFRDKSASRGRSGVRAKCAPSFSERRLPPRWPVSSRCGRGSLSAKSRPRVLSSLLLIRMVVEGLIATSPSAMRTSLGAGRILSLPTGPFP